MTNPSARLKPADDVPRPRLNPPPSSNDINLHTATMTIAESVKSAVGLGTDSPRMPSIPAQLTSLICWIVATRDEMRDAKLPIQYRDNCANLLIPLNRCRVDSYYLPWKCEVSREPWSGPMVGTCVDFGNCRQKDTATRNANTRSSSCGSRKWTS